MSRVFAVGLLLACASLSGCLVEVPDRNTSEAMVTWWPVLGTDERDFNSTCAHFGNETPFSQKPYHRC
jgi:hypothetical protein